jgi:hypothetical protein
MINMIHDGVFYPDFTPEDALRLGIPAVVVDAALGVAMAAEAKAGVRRNIERDAGDTLSLLGTTSDAATIAVLVGACFMASLDETTSYSAFRTKATAYMAAISGPHDPTEIAQAFLASLAAGEVRLPALEKGIVEVLDEVKTRGNAVAQAINPVGEA